MLRQILLDRARGAGRTLGDLWRLARHPQRSFGDARASADIFRELYEGGLVVSTAFPTPEEIASVKAVPAPRDESDATAKAAEAQARAAILAGTNTRGARAAETEPIAVRTLLQVDGNVALLIDEGFAQHDQRVLAALVQVHLAAVREAIEPLVRAQSIAAALRASVLVATSASCLAGGALAHWLAGLFWALVWAAASATVTGAFFVTVRWSLERYMRGKIRELVGR